MGSQGLGTWPRSELALTNVEEREEVTSSHQICPSPCKYQIEKEPRVCLVRPSSPADLDLLPSPQHPGSHLPNSPPRTRCPECQPPGPDPTVAPSLRRAPAVEPGTRSLASLPPPPPHWSLPDDHVRGVSPLVLAPGAASGVSLSSMPSSPHISVWPLPPASSSFLDIKTQFCTPLPSRPPHPGSVWEGFCHDLVLSLPSTDSPSPRPLRPGVTLPPGALTMNTKDTTEVAGEFTVQVPSPSFFPLQ